jgi:murein DD-endopeptidase MepM/ murein hydrolase activator NlpD
MRIRKHTAGRGPLIAALVAAFLGGAATDWWLRVNGPPRPVVTTLLSAERVDARDPPVRPEAPRVEPARAAVQPDTRPGAAIEELRRRDLRVPIDGMQVASLKGAFEERRGGDRPHEAVDILAARHTPVHAVEDGTIAKLFFSKAGGNTIYQFDPSGRFCYYYAHLERYADGLTEAERVARGDVIGYVGTSGNAPPGTPHLHFTVFELTPERRWWKGTAIDPFLIFSR